MRWKIAFSLLVKFSSKSSKMSMPETTGGKSSNITACSDVCIWGTWNPYDVCSDPKAHAIGFYAKMESSQGTGDDTALNGIKFICGYPSGSSSGQEITSGVGNWGSWEPSSLLKCSTGAFIISFQMLYEPFCGTCDDTAADGLRVQCSDGNVMEGKCILFSLRSIVCLDSIGVIFGRFNFSAINYDLIINKDQFFHTNTTFSEIIWSYLLKIACFAKFSRRTYNKCIGRTCCLMYVYVYVRVCLMRLRTIHCT